jgi:hypothetical protein
MHVHVHVHVHGMCIAHYILYNSKPPTWPLFKQADLDLAGDPPPIKKHFQKYSRQSHFESHIGAVINSKFSLKQGAILT